MKYPVKFLRAEKDLWTMSTWQPGGPQEKGVTLRQILGVLLFAACLG
jgi:hypothetical protein